MTRPTAPTRLPNHRLSRRHMLRNGGLAAESYRSIKARFEANARGAAQGLLADPTLAGLVDRIPFRPGGTVLGIDESDKDDLQSWFEILRHLLDLRRPLPLIADHSFSTGSSERWI